MIKEEKNYNKKNRQKRMKKTGAAGALGRTCFYQQHSFLLFWKTHPCQLMTVLGHCSTFTFYRRHEERQETKTKYGTQPR